MSNHASHILSLIRSDNQCTYWEWRNGARESAHSTQMCHLTGFCTSLKSVTLKFFNLKVLRSPPRVMWPFCAPSQTFGFFFAWMRSIRKLETEKESLAAFNLVWFLNKSETHTSRIHLWNGFIYFIHSVVKFPLFSCRAPSVAIKASQPGQLGPLCSRFLVSFAKHALRAVFLGLSNYFPILRAVRARHSETQMDWPAAEIQKWST